jgi:hypothetical protein
MISVAVIGSKKQQKLFASKHIYHTLKNYLTVLARCPKHKATMYTLQRIIKWLREHNEMKGADWLSEYWSGERGNWDIGAAGVGCPNANCGVESGWARIRKAVCSGLRSFSYAQFMTVFLTYETDQSIDDMSNFKFHRETIFFPSAPIFDKSIWQDVCDMTVEDFRMMRLGVYDTDDNFQRSIERIHDCSVTSNSSFISAALTLTVQEKKAPVASRDALCVIFPSTHMMEMFADEPDYFGSAKYRGYIGKCFSF